MIRLRLLFWMIIVFAFSCSKEEQQPEEPAKPINPCDTISIKSYILMGDTCGMIYKSYEDSSNVWVIDLDFDGQNDIEFLTWFVKGNAAHFSKFSVLNSSIDLFVVNRIDSIFSFSDSSFNLIGNGEVELQLDIWHECGISEDSDSLFKVETRPQITYLNEGSEISLTENHTNLPEYMIGGFHGISTYQQELGNDTNLLTWIYHSRLCVDFPEEETFIPFVMYDGVNKRLGWFKFKWKSVRYSSSEEKAGFLSFAIQRNVN